MYTDILIRFGELSTKGKNKMSFVRKLEKNIIKLVGSKPRVEYDRMFLEFNDKNMKGLENIFGIGSWSPVVKTKTNMKAIEDTIKFLLPKIDANTFKVAVKRRWKDFPHDSMELNNIFGGIVLNNKDIKVDIKNPEMKLEIEIRQDFTYIFVERYKGLGGYPAGINGKVLHMMSGGIDSPVAAFEMMKRGIHVDFLNFVTPPHTDEKTVEKVNKIIKLLMKYQGEAKVYRSEYTDLMNLIGLTSKQSYKITLMRRSFYRIGTIIAKNGNYLGISNGENVGQVASQTLESMNVIQNQSGLPIYRPILTRDKLETINQAIKIDTYDISIEKANESCEIFAPKAPVIKPRIKEAEKLEKELIPLITLEKKNITEKLIKIVIKK